MWFSRCLGVLASMLMCGCSMLDQKPATPAESVKEADPAAVETASGASVTAQGYALLADLLGDEKDVSKIRFVKRPGEEVTQLLKQISNTCGGAYKQLQAFGKTDKSLNLVDQRLPTAEVVTRKAISKSKEKTLLSSKGAELQMQLLLTQNEALTYGAHLAETTATGESDPTRHQFLISTATQLYELQLKVLDLLRTTHALKETPP
jgi:hypothetical protein